MDSSYFTSSDIACSSDEKEHALEQDAIEMMYSSDDMTISMQTSLEMKNPSTTTEKSPSGGKLITLQTENDFLRVSIERGGSQSEQRLRLSRTRSPSRRSTTNVNTAESFSEEYSNQPSPALGKGNDFEYEEFDVWLEDLAIQRYGENQCTEKPTTSLNKVVGAKVKVGKDGYFPPEAASNKSESLLLRESDRLGPQAEELNLEVSTTNEHCEDNKERNVLPAAACESIRELHEISCAHTLSDALKPSETSTTDEIRSQRRRRSSEEERTALVEYKCDLTTHKIALAGVGLYSAFMEYMDTPYWLNAGMTIGAAALITWDGVQKKQKQKKIAKVLEKIRGPWSEQTCVEDEQRPNNKDKKSNHERKREKGIVVSALVRKFQNYWQ